jgi:hypothetical protein
MALQSRSEISTAKRVVIKVIADCSSRTDKLFRHGQLAILVKETHPSIVTCCYCNY